MNKRIMTFILICSSMLLSAQTLINGNLANSFLLTVDDEASVLNVTTLVFGSETIFNEKSSLFASLSGEMAFPRTDTEDIPVSGDITRLYYKYSWDNLILRGGRMPFQDVTGYILNMNLDGINLNYLFGENNLVNLGFGFSGLTFDHAAPLVKTLDEEEEDLFLSPSRFIWETVARFGDETGFSGQFFSYGQAGMTEQAQELFSWYAGTGGNLPFRDVNVAVNYSYNGGFTPILSGLDTKHVDISAHLLQGSVKYFPLDLRHIGFKTELTGLYTSGDSFSRRELNTPGSPSSSDPGGISYLFTPISQRVISPILGEQPGNLAFINIKASITPLRGSYGRNLLETGIAGALYFRTANGPIHASGLNDESDSSYLGTELSCYADYQPYPDLNVKWMNSFLIPQTSGDGSFEDGRSNLEFITGLTLSLAL